MTKSTRNNILHIIGSLAFISIPIFSSPDFNTGKDLFSIPPFLQNFSRHILLLIYFYLNFYLLLPQFYYQRKKILFTVITVIAFFAILKIPDLLFPFQMDNLPPMDAPNGDFPKGHGMGMPWFHWLEGGIFQFLFVFILSYLLKINQRFDLIRDEKQAAEISYLKAQINPHFLFNTLNSLYALTITKSDEAPNAVLKLSGMMRYVVTESSEDFVPLEKEINYIKDYIELQKLRMDDSTQFSFSIVGDPMGKVIAPLLLIPFIENAFKYGLNPEEESDIGIVIQINENTLILDAKNKMVVDEVPDDFKTEKGIQNTTKRLDYIYPNQHELVFTEDNKTYSIHLKLELV